jgi:pyruvate formate lyase activating enzyme
VRDWHRILAYHVSAQGRCIACGAPVAGRFGHFDPPFGPRRIPVSIRS